jgi:hypothetical protein
VLWQHVFQAVHDARHSVHTPQPETRCHNTATLITTYQFYKK